MYQLKTLPQDFIVAESAILPYDYSQQRNNYFYYTLHKSGYTTFEAIDVIASVLNINSSLIGYAGLKDEDGITEQFISFPFEIDTNKFSHVDIKQKDTAKFLELSYFKKGCAPICRGELLGNNFCITVRKIPKNFADTLEQIKKISAFFVNYYGLQRFGLPNFPKTTHLIGGSIINRDYKKACQLLMEQPNKIGRDAKKYSGKEEEYLNGLDKRLLAFYHSSFYSFLWNNELEELIKRIFPGRCLTVLQEGMSYTFPLRSEDKVNLIAVGKDIRCTKAMAMEENIICVSSERPVVAQVIAECRNVFKDEIYEGFWAVTLEFFLSTGCYATIAIPQLLDDIYARYNK